MCPHADLALIPHLAEGTVSAELANPLPAHRARLGSVSVAVGGGSNPFYVDTSALTVRPAVWGPS